MINLYFWKNGNVVTISKEEWETSCQHDTSEIHGLAGCLCLDTRYSHSGRYGLYYFCSANPIEWEQRTYSHLVPEFRLALLLLGVE